MKIKKFTKEQVATGLAILFHCVGISGILFFERDFFTATTPINLLLMFVLLIWTQQEKNSSFFIFIAATFVIGFLVEVIGVNTGLLFGDYAYGKVLGIQWKQVPFLIAVNWFIIIYCSGISTQALLNKAIEAVVKQGKETPSALRSLSLIIDGATLAVLFDWLMEPVAVKLGFWQWKGDGSIPIFNYICWFVVSLLLLFIFRICKFNKQNSFAVNLLLIQAMFFLLLRTFL